jgi:hypothetical protein
MFGKRNGNSSSKEIRPKNGQIKQNTDPLIDESYVKNS